MLITCLTAGILVAGSLNLASILFIVSALATFALREPLCRLVRSAGPRNSPLSLVAPGPPRRGFEPGAARGTAECQVSGKLVPRVSGGRPDQRRQTLLRWAAMFAAVALLSGGLLLGLYRLWLLLPLGAIAVASLAAHAGFGMARWDRSIGAELVGIAQMTLSAPGAYYVTASSANGWAGGQTMLLLWLLFALHLGGSVFYVKLKAAERFIRSPARFRRAARPGEVERLRIQNITYQLGVIVLLLAFSPVLLPNAALPPFVNRVLPASLLLVAPFVPCAIKNLWGAAAGARASTGGPVSFKRLGLIETFFSTVFAGLLVAALRIAVP